MQKKNSSKKVKANLRKAGKAAVHRKKQPAAQARPRSPKAPAMKSAAASRKSQSKNEEPEVVVEAGKVQEADMIISGSLFSEFVVKNVGKQGVELVKALNASPHTDDKLASKMEVKVNEIRRMLNVLNGYGITRYDINKDGKGWLTFRWYLDREKLGTFHGVLQEKQNSQKVNLQENCNDFFYCVSCYKNQKLILPFDSAFELNFKCEGCGKILGVLNKDQASALFASGSKPSI